MVLDDEIYMGADGLADRLYAGLVHLQIFRAEQAEAVVVVEVALVRLEGEEVDLDGVVALGHSLLGLAGVVVRGGAGG